MKKLALGLLLSAILIACYSNTFSSPPILDDFHTFVRNAPVHIDSISLQNIQQLSRTQFGIGRFIPMVTFGWDFWWGDGQIYAFHVTNLVIHMLAALALFFLVSSLLEARGRRASPGGEHGAEHQWDVPFFLAFAVTALWVLHPVQTNAVTYLVQRMASLQALFFTLSVAFYVRGRMAHEDGGKLFRVLFLYGLCGFTALGAFLSKENSLILPFVILLTEVWFFRPHLSRDLRRLWTWVRGLHWVYWCVAVAVVGWGCYEGFQFVSRTVGGYGGRHFTLEERLLTQARIVVWYLSLLVLPLPSRLSLEHDVVLSTSLWNPVTTLPSILLLGVLAGLAVRYRRAYPLVTYGVAWFFMNLVIESSIVPLELMFEHRLYLPSMGFFMTLVFLAARLAPRWSWTGSLPVRDRKRLAWSVTAILCSCLSLMTFQRNEAWRDILTINHDNVIKAPNLPRAHANYAVALLRAGRLDEAIAHGERTLELGRRGLEDHVVGSNAIVGALMEKGDHEEAVRRGEELIASRPPHSDASSLPILMLRVADSHRELGNLPEAMAHTLEALDLTWRHHLMADQKSAALFVMHSIARDAAQKAGNPSPGLLDSEAIRLMTPVTPCSINASKPRIADSSTERADEGPGEPSLEPATTQPATMQPSNPRLLIPIETWMAGVLLRMGDRQEARRLLARAREAHPQCEETGELWTRMEREDAMTAVQAASWELKNRLAGDAYSSYAVSLRLADHIRRKNYPEPILGLGERLAERALALRGASADAHLVRGWYHYERKEMEEATARARTAVELEPQYARAWLGLGYFLARTGRGEEAVGVLEHVLVLYPGYPQRRVLMGLIGELEGGLESR